jgi:hypothetical protein
MAEIALSLFAMLGTGAAAGGTAAAAAGTGIALTAAEAAAAVASAGAAALPWAAGTTVSAAGAGAAGASGILGMLQGASSAASIFSGLAGGVLGMRDANASADAQQMQAEEEVLRIKKEELKKIGAARVAFAASGVSLDSAEPVIDSLRQDAAYEAGLTRRSGRIAARALRSRGSAGMLASTADALGKGLDFGIDIAKRG